MGVRPLFALSAMTVLSACIQDGPAAYTGGPRDPNSSTVFNMTLTPGSIEDCVAAEPGMSRPMTVAVQDNTGVLDTAGGIHYGLTRVAPNVYAGGDWIKIRANLASTPKTLSIRTNDKRCTWIGTAT